MYNIQLEVENNLHFCSVYMYIHLQSDFVVTCGCIMAVDCVVEVDVVIDTNPPAVILCVDDLPDVILCVDDPPDVILCTDPSVVVIMEVNKNLFWYRLGAICQNKFITFMKMYI